MTDDATLDPERQRLERHRAGREDWRLWGPYLSERAWGTVREDYSAGGDAWSFLPHDHARSRAYRWSEDGLGGICDEGQHLCFAVAVWNGRDPYLKERAFGLTGPQGNRGEDVKDTYFYLDATPSHSWLRYVYKYPQTAFPYDRLIAENGRRSRHEPPFGLIDTGAFDDSRYFDVEVSYAKAGPKRLLIRITLSNRGPETATIHLLPTLWFRNTWSWGDPTPIPAIRVSEAAADCAWAVRASHAELGDWHLYGRHRGDLLFTDNETNLARLFGVANTNPFVKDAFHRFVVNGEAAAVNPARTGTKMAALSVHTIEPGHHTIVDLVLTDTAVAKPFAGFEVTRSSRESEASIFYDRLLPEASPQDLRILRQSLAGMIWCKQFFHYPVERWLQGDVHSPSESRWRGRNRQWRHLDAHDVISMPDSWEYPWFAAWDLAFHCAALALIDVDFAKDQIELVLSERYLHPNGQIPAYEWNFSDVNPPVHAMGALKVFRADRIQRRAADTPFLKRVFHKLLLNYAWWINRKDADGANVFEGGFLGLDNISVFDRSHPLPPGYSLKQADATGWMAMFALNMTVIALEITAEDPSYEDIAIQCYEQFLAIANTIAGYSAAQGRSGASLWDPEAGFFKDLVVTPDGRHHRVDVYSMVGLIPLFATEIIDRRLLANAPRFAASLGRQAGGVFQGNIICACPTAVNHRGEHLLSIVDHTMLPRILERLLDENQFLSRYGVRSVSRLHAEHRHLGNLPGVGEALIEYVPGESTSPLFGGNSNWRGPIWMPVNFALIQAIEKFQRFLGDGFTVAVPCLGGERLTLNGIATLIAERIVDIYRADGAGRRPAFGDQAQFHADPHWKDLLLFYEYFHAETGQGLGAAHQTGWTGLIANLVMRRYRTEIPAYWSRQVAAAAE